MPTRQLTQGKPATATLPSWMSVRSSLLHRKGSCGRTPGPSGECAECLAGWTGPFLYARDYVGVPPLYPISGSALGSNPTVSFLGSFTGTWSADYDCEGPILARLQVTNNTNLTSGTRLPVLGYQEVKTLTGSQPRPSVEDWVTEPGVTSCLTTPNSPTANCVRKFLQDRLAANPAAVKVLAGAQKPLEKPDTYPVYQGFVQAFLTPLFYRDHVDAYAQCCCPCPPAPYWAWMGVSLVPIQPCSAVYLAIRHFGSCHCTPGAW